MSLCEVYDTCVNDKYLWYFTETLPGRIVCVNTVDGFAKIVSLPQQYYQVINPFELIRYFDSKIMLIPQIGNSVVCYDIYEKKCKELPISGVGGNQCFAGAVVVFDTMYLFTTDYKVFEYKKNAKSIELLFDKHKEQDETNIVTSLIFFDKDIIWIMLSSRRKIAKYRISTNELSVYELSNDKNVKYDFLYVESNIICLAEKKEDVICIRYWKDGCFDENTLSPYSKNKNKTNCHNNIR